MDVVEVVQPLVGIQAMGGSMRSGRAAIEHTSLPIICFMVPWIARQHEALAALLINQNCSDILPMVMAMLPPAALAAASFLKAKAKAQQAIRHICGASLLLPQGHGLSSILDKAAHHLQTYSPCGAAKAQRCMLDIFHPMACTHRAECELDPLCQAWGQHAYQAMREANMEVNDALALHCHAQCVWQFGDAQDRSAFMCVLMHAHGGCMSKDMSSRVFFAYHKLFPPPVGFVSNNQVAADRRKGPRPARRHALPAALPQGSVSILMRDPLAM